MGSKRLDEIGDYNRHGYKLRVDCRTCRRVTIIEPLELVLLCQRRGWSRQMGVIERRFKCSHCGGRDARCGPVQNL